MLSVSNPTQHAERIARMTQAVSRTTERLSSGLRVNGADDDAAGLAISETLRTQVRGTAQATKNIQDAIRIVQIGEDGVQATTDIMQRMRELVVQAANGTNSDTSLTALQTELDAIKRLALASFETAHKFREELDGVPFDIALDFQVGANQGDMLRVDYEPIRTALIDFIIPAYGYDELIADPEAMRFAAARFGLAGGGTPPPGNTPVPPPPLFPPFPPGTTFSQAFPKMLLVNPNTPGNIQNCFDIIDQARVELVNQAAYLGASHNRLEYALASQQTANEQFAASDGRIRDADMAAETTAMARQQIVQKSAISMMAQATTRQQSILTLLRESAE